MGETGRLKITVQPVEEIIIETFFKTELDILIKSQAISENPKLFWCNGIMFVVFGYDDNKIASKTIETHILHYAEFNYAICPEFIEQAKWNGYSIEVQNVTNHPEYEALTLAINEGKLQ